MENQDKEKGVGVTDLAAVKMQEDPEDILAESLGIMFDLKPINVGSPGSSFTYRYHGIPSSGQYPSTTIALHTPDTLAANWSLHASAIWVSAIYLADHLHQLDIPAHTHFDSPTPLRVLELGASAGLPGILTAKFFPSVNVTVSDYPDERLIKTLSSNIGLNNVEHNCRAVPYAWGTDASDLLSVDVGFDVILAADTLWNRDLHDLFADSLAKTLRRCPHSRIHLVAGLHTGRYTIQNFLNTVVAVGLETESSIEHEADGTATRPWNVHRGGEDDQERRRWVVWSLLKWRFSEGSHGILENNCNAEHID